MRKPFSRVMTLVLSMILFLSVIVGGCQSAPRDRLEYCMLIPTIDVNANISGAEKEVLFNRLSLSYIEKTGGFWGEGLTAPENRFQLLELYYAFRLNESMGRTLYLPPSFYDIVEQALLLVSHDENGFVKGIFSQQ